MAFDDKLSAEKLGSSSRIDARFGKLFAFLVAALAFLKGARLPNLWSATQAQFDYSRGFIRRGLFGEFLTVLHIHRYLPFIGISYALLFLLVVLLWRYAWRWVPAEDSRAPLGIAIFFSSFSFTYLASLVGYLDIVLALLTLAVLFARSFKLRAAMAVPVVICGTLIHEMFAIVFLPLIVLSFLLDVPPLSDDASDARVPDSLHIAYAALLVGIALATTIMVTNGPPITSQTELIDVQQTIAQHVDFPLRRDAVAVLGETFRENLRTMNAMWHSKLYWFYQFESVMEFLPSILVFLWMSLCSLRRRFPARRHLLEGFAAISSLSPLFLHFLGWDIFRWWALTVLTAFLTMLAIRQAVDVPSRAATLLPSRKIAALIIALNLAGGVGLMDGYSVNPFPFQAIAKSCIELIHSHHLILPTQ